MTLRAWDASSAGVPEQDKSRRRRDDRPDSLESGIRDREEAYVEAET